MALKGIIDRNFTADVSFVPINYATIIDCSHKVPTISNVKLMEKAQAHLFLVKKAILFSITEIGNCSDRAAYASLILFNALKETGIKVALQSLETKDQFYVCLGSKETGWKIYDPLTNPSIVFDVAEYQEKMLGYFPLYAAKKSPYKLVINQKVYGQYIEQLNGAASLCAISFTSRGTTNKSRLK